MADIEYGQAMGAGDGARAGGPQLNSMVNALGAAVSLALIAGLGWWGYQLLVRDVSGVPVVRALDGPMRVAPDDPGGASAQYQGLAVNNIPAVGEAEAPADRLLLAPRPTALTGEDQPEKVLDRIAEEQANARAAASQPGTPGQSDATPQARDGVSLQAREAAPQQADRADRTGRTSQPDQADQAAIIENTLKQLAGGGAEHAAANGAEARAAPGAGPVERISADVPGVSRSLVPLARPAGLKTGAASASAADSAASSASSAAAAPADPVAWIDPSAIPAGTRLVQLGAYDTPDLAKAAWNAAARRFEAFMAQKSRVIERAQSGGKVFYRLRAYGFSDLSDARRFCSALLAEGANCIPVVTR